MRNQKSPYHWEKPLAIALCELMMDDASTRALKEGE